MKSNEIEHAIHPGHVLKLKCSENPYTCDGCKELGLSRVSSASSTATSICMRNVQGLRLQGLLSTLFSRKVLFYSSRDQDAADTVRPVGGRWRDFNINTRVTQHAACIHALACLKDMLYRNWRSQLIHAAAAAASGENFNIHNAIMPRPHQSETIQDLVLFQGGLSHKLKQFWKKLVLVIKFMASSIFGNPTAGSSSIYEAMISIATTQLTNVAGTTSRYR
ncbi:uncharacterized protein LOC112491042 [Ziziphus jujuba]|uniref:Uncharacterized protein LOC112491042 n=1 Tax=Ziziphus jujuba TaxID=326968 RepID=A0A6P6G0T6_ZIZJJ|nr:uncharacterized protein LOC112491042 [Ziziphus jujuba]